RVPEPSSAEDVLPQVTAYIPSTQLSVGTHYRTAANPQDSPIVRLAFTVEKDRDSRVGIDVQRCQSSVRRAEVDFPVPTHEVERVDVGSSVARDSRNARHHRATEDVHYLRIVRIHHPLPSCARNPRQRFASA